MTARRVGLNLVFLDPRMAGVRVAAVNLVRSILEGSRNERRLHFKVLTTSTGEACLLGDGRIRDAMACMARRPEIVRLPVDPGRKAFRFLVEQTRSASRALEVDLLHSFDYTFPYVSRYRNIATIHDLNYLSHPETFSRTQRWFRRFTVPLTLRLADRIVAVSGAARDEIAARFPDAKSRIVVVHHGVAPVHPQAASTSGAGETREVPREDRPYVLSVGTLKVHKNYARLLEAFAGLSDVGLKLIIAGRDDGLSSEILKSAESLGIGERVRLSGSVSTADLRQLYDNAALFVAPSLYEGFGLPVLEAMAAGVPVACSNLAVFQEVGGEAAAYFDPHDPSEICATLEDLLASPHRRAELVRKGSERVRHFTWENSATKALALYRELLGSRPT